MIQRLAALCAVAVCACSMAAEPSSDGFPSRWLSLEVSVNDAQAGTWVMLQRHGTLYVPRKAFDEWRVTWPDAAQPIEVEGEVYLPLSGMKDFSYQIDDGSQSLKLQLPPGAFRATYVRAAEPPPLVVARVQPSAFINYDLSYSAARYGDDVRTHESGLLGEMGLSGAWGLVTTSFVAHRLHAGVGPSGGKRLESTFLHHDAGAGRLWRIGDALTGQGLTAQPVAFGGLQWGSDEALQPGRWTTPWPRVSGVATGASTLQVYVNDVLRQVTDVPAGPFTLDAALPQGSSEARVVVRDLLGRETTVTQSLYSHSELLADGVSQWSLEGGFLRYGLGSSSADYRRGFVSGLWRHGVTEAATVEAQGSLESRGFRGTFAAQFTLPIPALATAAMGVSHLSGGTGATWAVGLENESTSSSFSLRAQGATSGYRPLGLDEAERLQLSMAYGVSNFLRGNLQLQLAHVVQARLGPVSTLGAGYTMPLGERGALTFTLLRAQGQARGTALGLSLVYPLGKGTIVNSSAVQRAGQTDTFVNAASPQNSEGPWGWRVLAGRRDRQTRAEGGMYWLNDAGLGSGNLSTSPQQSTLRLGWQGGLAWVDTHAFFTRKIDHSLALVEVPAQAGIEVRVNGSTATRTNANGVALVAGLLPFTENRIRLDPNALPLSVQLDSIEQVAVPAWRSAVKVMFPLRGGLAALLRLVLDDGGPVPSGATLQALDDPQGELSYVARRGEAFVSGLHANNSLRLRWAGQSCDLHFTLANPSDNDFDLQRVGPLRCVGVTR